NREEDITSVISVGDAIEAKFTGVDRKARVINLSVRAKAEAEESAAIAQVNKQEVEVPNAMAAAFAQAKGE
ncbi:MAG: 30S ribosomal protein S1, partial [Haemophilus parahaemolyticus]|nr:30S ribosomal protein S1 [Haemophilus parahaemolyticus]